MTFLNYVFITLFSASAAAQSDTLHEYPKDCFCSPLDIPFLLAGNFGEPRASHFHMGLDIRTQEHEGLNVYAIGDGYVSRINVSPYGYGNALYITYPNGYTSVYGHLSRFNDTITALVRREQYAKEEFAVDVVLKPYALPVSKGQLVAYSGNTGGSGGPHLHFEIRDMMERPINPLDFGYKVADHVAPSIGGVKFYPMGDKKNDADAYRTAVLASGHEYTLKTGIQKLNAKQVGVSVNTFDRTDEMLHSVGLYDLKLYDNDALIFEYTVDRLSFDYIRNVIAQVDYPIFMHEGSRAYQKCFLETNNAMPSYYHYVKNRGIIDLSDGKVHHIKMIAADHEGDKSTLTMELMYDEASTAFKPRNKHYMKTLVPDHDNIVSGDDFKITIPGRCLLDSEFVNYSSAPPKSPIGVFSNVIKIGENLDLLSAFTISIREQGLPESLRSKALIVWRSAGGGTAAKGGKWEGDMLTAQSREFGTFFITIDTTPPVITAVNILNGKNMRPLKNITMKIRDGLSGLSEYHGYIDGKWELMELDGKTGLLKMALPKTLAPGSHVFKLVVSDDRNNTSQYTANFNY